MICANKKRKLFILFLPLLFCVQIPSGRAAIPGSIQNLHAVTAEIFRGARPELSGLDELSQMGVKTVIDLQGGDLRTPLIGGLIGNFEPGELASEIAEEDRETTERGMAFFNFPLNSIVKVSDSEGAEIQALLQIMNDPRSQPIFVHCEHGIDRTGLVVALYRVFYQGWTPNAAHAEMVKMGHHGLFDELFTGSMDRYFAKLTGWQDSD